MKKIAIISMFILILFISVSFVSANDSLENASLTTVDAQMYPIEISTDDSISAGEISEIIVDDDNYDQYFTKATGKFKSDVDASKINTLKIGNVSDKLFTITKPLNIMPISPDCQISNGVIHLIEGSDGSNVTGLTINNTKGEIYADGVYVCKLHGIWFSNSSYNLIYNNTIRIAEEEGCYAMPMGYSSYNRILYNDMQTHITACMVMGSCYYNNISYNKLEVLKVRAFVAGNVIYFNPYHHADYKGGGNCSGTYISNNYLKSGSNDVWSVVMSLGWSNNVQVINNTVIRGYAGITIGEDLGSGKNLVKGNMIINSTFSITCGEDSLISNNKIIGSSQDVGIVLGGQEAIAINNEINYENLNVGIFLSSNNTIAINNKITLLKYGKGIEISGNNTTVSSNSINTGGDEGIYITGNDNLVNNNLISTKNIGIKLEKLRGEFIDKIYNNTIISNKICSEDYAVYIEGHVFNTTVKDNIIETNKSEAFYTNIFITFEDKDLGNISDNSINGVIEDTNTLIIDDNNFYDYFDEDGYLKYEFGITEKRMLFFTFLSNKNIFITDQISLSSNKQPNLLYNVTITLTADACDSSIKDFKFYNFDKPSIVLDGIENVEISNNEFTTIASNIFDISVISIRGGCYDSKIVNNDIFINSNADYTYGISISEPYNKISKYFSKNFDISNNNIFVKSSGVGEGIYMDALVNSVISSNDISVISDGSAYGIAIANVFGRPHDIKINNNEIVINSKEMSYLIETYMSDFIDISNNYIKGTSNGIYGIGIYNSQDIKIKNNEIVVNGKNLTNNSANDVLGKGNSAIHVYGDSNVNILSENIFDVNNCKILSNDSSIIDKFLSNGYVVSNYNYDLYFDSGNKLIKDIFKESDEILFKNFTNFKTMKIDFPILIKPYNNHLNHFSSYLILTGNFSFLNVTGFDFRNAILELNNVSNVNVTNNSFISSNIRFINGINNTLLNNSFIADLNKIIFNSTSNTMFAYNNLNITSSVGEVILIDNSNETVIFNNIFIAFGNLFNLITSNSSLMNNISYNDILINSTGDIHAYLSLNTTKDNFINNNINVYGDYTNSVVFYDNLSSNNNVMFNKIISNSIWGKCYAVIVNSTSPSIISNNYLISSNGYRRGNDAVNASYSIVKDNTPFDLYVSANANVSGNGSKLYPFSTIAEALKYSLSGTVIYLLPGYYNESNLVIDKNITLTAINQEGNTYINALNDRLFDIMGIGALTVNALKIYNGFSVNGGGLFYNKGLLVINNSMIYNSSSYYDNSNPTFKQSKYDKKTYFSQDCKNSGLGGAILNYGSLFIDSSDLFDNFAHKGGALADFGKTVIKNSLIYNNSGVHGGAIYIDSKKEFAVDNCNFFDNTAVTTLDYCAIRKLDTTQDHAFENSYQYHTDCGIYSGSGGAIFSTSNVNISSSLFERNIAKTGGAIATDSNIVNYYSHDLLNVEAYVNFKKDVNAKFTINNSVFRYNEVKDTRCGNLTMLNPFDIYNDYYNSNFHGGAIFGSFKELNIYDSLFESNVANSNGGSLDVQCENSTISESKFINNTAGAYGGALEIYGNSLIFDTEISENSARNGGGLHYNSHAAYNHIHNNVVMFNVTVSKNSALDRGGAFLLSNTNFQIKNSNIYDNVAPNGDTLVGFGNIDARSNWWGSVDGPDNSVRSIKNVLYRTWLSDKVDWTPTKISGSGKEDNSNNNGGNNYHPSDKSTGSSVRTGSTLNSNTENSNSNGYNFPGHWPSSGSENGNSKGFNPNGLIFSNTGSSNSKTPVRGNTINPNSMSKVNSSSINDLSSVGMTSNAADSSGSSQSSSNGDGGDAGSLKAYEIKKEVKKEIPQEDDFSFVNLLFIVLWIFLLLGFYRAYDDENN